MSKNAPRYETKSQSTIQGGEGDIAMPMNHPYQQRIGKPGRIGYIRKDIPDFEVPEYKGERYRALVPDTLDLQDMAAWGVNGLTSSNNPDADYEAYWGAEFGTNPLRMANGMDGGICQVKYLESLPLLRLASGSTQNQMVDRRWMEPEVPRGRLQYGGPDVLPVILPGDQLVPAAAMLEPAGAGRGADAALGSHRPQAQITARRP